MDEVFYRVTVTLQKQTVMVYGQPYPLTAGMVLEGVILGDKRTYGNGCWSLFIVLKELCNRSPRLPEEIYNHERISKTPTISFGRKLPMIHQAEVAECGLGVCNDCKLSWL